MLFPLLFGSPQTTVVLFLEMAAAMAVVVLAGSRFAMLADRLATRLDLESGWVGLILLATVTSLPEVVTGGTATAIGNADMAFAAIFGSCCFNITIIVLLNAVIGGGSVLRSASASHALTSSFGIVLAGVALLGIVVVEKVSAQPQVAQVCEVSWAVLIAVVYIGCMRLTHRYDQLKDGAVVTVDKPRRRAGARLTSALVLVAAILVAASWWLAQLGDILSDHPIECLDRPLGATFVGACFLALATSLPEIATSIAAVRLGNLDLALGNIFGSNMFNIFVIPMLKVISLLSGESLLVGAASFHTNQAMITGILAILLTSIAVAGLTYKSRRRMLRRFGFDSVVIGLTYLVGMYLVLMDAG